MVGVGKRNQRISNDYWLWLGKKVQFVFMQSFGQFPRGTVVEAPYLIRNKSGVFLGKDVTIRRNLRIEVVKEYAGKAYKGRLEIGNGTCIENDVHITVAEKVTIGEKVLIAPRVVIVDSDHGFTQRDLPIMTQPLSTAPVVIGDGSWIGAGAVILKGTNIGKNCVVGANAVVKGTVPDYSIVVGNPGKVILKDQLS
jgi:acetyltransferase-like isoleucine patch superfamily enzyme